MAIMRNVPIGEVLKDMGYINDAQLSEALQYQRANKDSGKRLGTILREQGYVTELQMLSALAKKMNLHLQSVDNCEIDPQAVKKIPKDLSVKYCMIAVAVDNGRLVVITNDPLNFYGIEDVRLVTGMPLVITLDEKEKIVRAIDNYYSEFEAKQVIEDINSEDLSDADALSKLGDEAAQQLENGDDQKPVIKLLNGFRGVGKRRQCPAGTRYQLQRIGRIVIVAAEIHMGFIQPCTYILAVLSYLILCFKQLVLIFLDIKPAYFVCTLTEHFLTL